MLMYNEKIETLPREALRALQNERLVTLVQRLYRDVAFYRQQFDRAGLRPEDIRGLDDLHRLPFTRKSDLRDHYPYGLFAKAPTELRRIHASSGTTGKPTVVGYTKNDIDLWADMASLPGAWACTVALPNSAWR